ncbi:DUF871 domain-containing protein [Thermohalobacter berrensis]|uniref:Cell surface protein n=1 Tax=Thermohalobacter berrensis TaxID=99594 RepID=A0A419T466_9FIRM|nr:MupG family TIM beta-alpha barrel fold protein [Thermohalobacter berrensis]RKD32252.1 hypothetical protein BET03_02770 [Thermohalobacter berrensis]
MTKGISIYLGLDYGLDENLKLIEKAYKKGFKRIFTSLHIPEANYKRFLKEFNEIVKTSNKYNMEIIADISPRTFKYLGCDANDLKLLKEKGIYGIRTDFGFTEKEIASFSRNDYGLKIEINASTITEDFIKKLEGFGANFNNILASHNYYPRPNTGLSKKTLLEKNNILRKYEIEIGAFIPSQNNPRAPIYEGLPTLEEHRNLRADICAKHLFVLGIDSVIFGDGIPSDKELKLVGGIDKDILNLRIKLLNPTDMEKKILSLEHTNRIDEARDVIRSTVGRNIVTDIEKFYPHDNLERNFGYVTIDNKKYKRYCGELQIPKKELPPDERVNVVGEIVEEEKFLINYIKGNTKFKFTVEEEK